MSTRAVAALALVACVIAVLLVLGPFSGGSGHVVRARFASVEQLTPGLEVRLAGRKVGSISKIKLTKGGPIVSMEIDEGDVWPLPRGTTAEARWGSTTSLAYRYIELHPGRTGELKNHAFLAATTTPVELDQYYRIFRGHTTKDVSALVSRLAATVGTKGGALKSGLAAAPGGLDNTTAVLAQLGSSQQALDQLVAEGGRVTAALGAKQDELGPLIDHMAATFKEFGQNARAEQVSLQRGPQALTTAQGTLARLDTSLTGLQGLVDDIAPGARKLQTLAPQLRSALFELNKVGPLAASTLATGTKAAAPLRKLIDTGTTFMPRLSSTFDQFNPMLDCMRPYTPELGGMLATWTGYNDNYDQNGHYARTFPLAANPLIVPDTPLDSKQIVASSLGGFHYAMPRPPGLNAGDPKFLPQCGAGPDSVNPAKDPESNGP